MGPAAVDPINPYAPPQCASGRPAPALVSDEPIVLRGDINLSHQVLVLRRLRGQGTKWLRILFVPATMCIVAPLLYRFWQTGDWNALTAALLPLAAACYIWFGSWMMLAAYFGALGLLGIAYHQPLSAMANGDGLRLRGPAGEEFQPWSSFSRMEMFHELIVFYGQGSERHVPIVILNIHWCASSTDQERLWSLVGAKFGARAEGRETVQVQRPVPRPPAANGEMNGDESIVLAGPVDLDQLLRIERLKRRSGVLTFIGIVFALAVVVGVATLYWSQPRLHMWIACGMQLTFLGLLYLACLLKPRVDAWRLARSFEQGRRQAQWTTWTISSSGVHMLSESLETHESWDQLQYRGEGEDLLVLCNPRNLRLHFLPREFATAEQWERVRELARGERKGEGH